MTLRLKIILALISISILASLPLATFILNEQQKDLMKGLVATGMTNIVMFSETTKSILLMNGGEILPSQLDSRELIRSFEPLFDNGLILAESVLLSSRAERNGIVINRILNPNLPETIKTQYLSEKKIAPDRIEELLNKVRIQEVDCPGNVFAQCLQFIETCNWKQGGNFCLVRMLLSTEKIIDETNKLNDMVKVSSFMVIVVAIILGMIFTRLMTKPIDKLIRGVERISQGDLLYQVKITSKDEIGRLAQAFNAMAQDLNTSDQLKNEFLANTSHELRTPLNGIIGITESLIDGVAGKLPEQARKNLLLVSGSGRRLSALVNDLLDFTRLRHQDLKLTLSQVDLCSLADVVITLLRSQAQEHNCQIINNIEPDLPMIVADENRLQQVFFNLLGNAIKFAGQTRVIIHAETIHGFMKIWIEDKGVGIPDNQKKKIFDSFVQVDGSEVRRQEGVGIGLAISKKIVELHNGEIGVIDNLPKGSRFFFTIPLEQENHVFHKTDIKRKKNREKSSYRPNSNGINEKVLAELEKQAPSIINLSKDTSLDKENQDLSQKSILIVDDDLASLTGLENQLGFAGFSVDSCLNGYQALEKLAKNKYDLVILDIMMPNISGYQVLQEIRKQFGPEDLPVILLTAKNLITDIVSGFDSGANDYLVKPFQKWELLARVRNMLRIRNAINEREKLTLIEKELDISRMVQSHILTAESEYNKIQNLEIAVSYLPFNGKVSGDYYNITSMPENKLTTVMVADATGHGIQAALSTMQIDVLNKQCLPLVSPEDRMSFINSALTKQIVGKNFFTAFIVNIYADRLCYARAGHPHQILIRKNSISLLKAGGRILGFYEHSVYERKEIAVEPGDILVLFSDGIFEEFDEKKQEFGEERLKEALLMLNPVERKMPVAKINDSILAQLASFRAGSERNDDTTLITIRI